MQQPEFVCADPVADRAELIALNVEYLSWVFGEIETMFGVAADAIVGMPAREYVPTVIDKVCGAPSTFHCRWRFMRLALHGDASGSISRQPRLP